ncbi:phage tail assembly chaperone [Pseudomonas lundensis]|uniref:phage tail assembly chaperone n=1 Tax=Pseudomonas lundensis TaxID=86185 RepID=UPI001D02B3BB|nr:phage tail assembly chaperone [Pseudomonas lundensis]
MANKYAVFGQDRVRICQLHEGLHKIPESAVLISESLFMRMTQETDGVWMLNEDKTITKHPAVESVPDLSAQGRQWRDTEIENIKWLRERHRDEGDLGIEHALSTVQFNDLLSYLQALRDWPLSSQFPSISSRPTVPDWLADVNKLEGSAP